MSPKAIVVVPNSTTWTGPWLGATRATALQRVANRAIVCHVLDALMSAGVREAAIVAPLDVSDEIAACVDSEGPPQLTIHHLRHDAPAQRGAIDAVVDFVGESACVMHRADGLLGQPLLPLLGSLKDGHDDALLLVRDGGHETTHLRIVATRPAATGAEAHSASHGAAGVCLLGAGVLARLSAADCGDLIDFGAIAAQVSREGGATQILLARRWREFCGDALDLLDLNRTMLDALESEARADIGSGNRFEGQIEIHPSAQVDSSVIVGPVVVAADAQIIDSYIGPHTAIAERVRIEGAELERSIVLADASVLHVGGRLVASIVGRNARVFRDFSVPRALRLKVGDGDEVALC